MRNVGYKNISETVNPNAFSDINNHWAMKEIAAMKEIGIIAGYEDGTFRPDQSLTRAEAVKLVNRMFDRGPLYGENLSMFTDVPTTHWAYHEIAEAAQNHFYLINPNVGENIVK